MSQKSRLENKKTQAITKITTIQNPTRNSIIIAIIWIIIIFVFSGLLVVINHRDYLWNINLAAFIGDAIAFIWLSLYWGFAEKLMLKGKNMQNKQLKKLYQSEIPKYDLTTYRKYKERKSAMGIIVLGTIMLIITIVTIIIQQV